MCLKKCCSLFQIVKQTLAIINLEKIPNRSIFHQIITNCNNEYRKRIKQKKRIEM
jgi:hypothetical protein